MRSVHLLIGLALVYSHVASGHHSPARFDLSRIVTLEGTVARYEFTNPHVYIYLDVAAADGAVTTWELEASSTPNLVRRGWSADSLHVGERVRVRVNPPRRARLQVARARSVEWSDGRMLAVRGEGSVIGSPSADARAGSIEGVWLGRYGLAQVGTNLSDWPLTPKGRAAQAAYDGTQNPQVDCIPVAAPLLMLYSNIYAIDVDDTQVTIDIEWMNVRRVIYLDGRPHPDDSTQRTNQGHSVGYWEGSTLVVDTRNFADNGAGNAFEVPSGAAKRLTERFTLDPDGRRLLYRFVLEDPEYLSAPVDGSGRWDYRPDLKPLPNRCDPEIARRFLHEN